MGSHGTASARFARALKTGNPLVVKAAALEARPLSLPDALRYTLFLLQVGEDEEADRALVRWHAYWSYQARIKPSAAEAALVLDALRALDGPSEAIARRTLRQLFEARGEGQLVRALDEHLPPR